MKKQITMALVVTLLTGMMAFAATSTPQVHVYTIPVWGPSTNSSLYTGWAIDTVSNMHAGGNISNDWHLATPYFIQGPDKTNNSVWFATRVVSVSSNYMFSPNWLTFTEASSEAGNSFSNKMVYTNSYIYTPQAMGVVWASGISNVITTGEWTNKVDEFVFIGHQSKYFIVSSTSQSNSVDSFFNSAAINFRITGTFTLDDGVNPAVSASHSFYRQTIPTAPIISILRSGTQQELVSLSGISTNDTWTIQRSPAVLPTMWTDVATLSGGLSSFNWQNGTNVMEFFRASLQ